MTSMNESQAMPRVKRPRYTKLITFSLHFRNPKRRDVLREVANATHISQRELTEEVVTNNFIIRGWC